MVGSGFKPPSPPEEDKEEQEQQVQAHNVSDYPFPVYTKATESRKRDYDVNDDSGTIEEAETVTVTGQFVFPDGSHPDPANHCYAFLRGGLEEYDGSFVYYIANPKGEFEIEYTPDDTETPVVLFYGQIYTTDDGYVDWWSGPTLDETDQDLGEITLPEGHILDTKVVDEDGEPIEDAGGYYHKGHDRLGEDTLGLNMGTTGSDGVAGYEEGDHTGRAVSDGAFVEINVSPPPGVFREEATKEVTVESPTTAEVTLPEIEANVEIEDWHGLYEIRDNLDEDYILVTDLDEHSAGYEQYVTDPDAGWEPIGESGDEFTGSFDGNGHEISGLTIDRPAESYVGLFGSVSGLIGNVDVVNVDVTGYHRTGGIAGFLDGGTIVNSTIDGTVDGSDAVGGIAGNVTSAGFVLNSSAVCSVTGDNAAGGVVGRNSGAVEECSGNVDVETLNEQEDVSSIAGGIVGRNNGTVLDCEAQGEVVGDSRVGGSVGRNDGTIETSSAEVEVERKADEDSTAACGGLVGSNRNGGEIKNSVAYGSVTSESEGEFNPTGGGIGYNGDGTISDVSSHGIVSGTVPTGGLIGYHSTGTIEDSNSTSQVNGDFYTGGLVGFTTAKIANSYAEGDVNGSNVSGSLVGFNSTGEIVDSHAEGDVTGHTEVGGLVGSNGGEVRGSHASGNAIGDSHVGGLAGWNQGEVVNSYAGGDVTGDSVLGGLVGGDDGQVTNSHYNVDEVKINGEHKLTIGGLFEGQYQDWHANDKSLDLNDYNSLQVVGEWIEISDAQGVRDALWFIQDPSKSWRLAEDIDLTGADAGLFFPCLAGDLDGNGHTVIVDIDNPTTRAVGLIGVTSDGTITELSVDGQIIGEDLVGGLVGMNNGEVIESAVSGDVTGEQVVGGIVGLNDGEVVESYASGDVTGDEMVGGLLGGNNNGEVEESYACGEVSGDSKVGGLVGDNGNEVISSYWDTESSTQDDGFGDGTGDASGLTTPEMQGKTAADNMESLNFQETWQVETDPDDYPTLQWQDVITTFEVSIDTIQIDGTSTIEIKAPDAEQVALMNLWTNWVITEIDADGGSAENISPPDTPDDGTVTLTWDPAQDINASLDVTPNEDVNPDPKYIGGEYLIDVQLNDGEDKITSTLYIE